MRGNLLALAFAVGVSSTTLAQQSVTIAPEAQSSRARTAASYLDRGNGWLKKGEFERATADQSLTFAFDAGYAGLTATALLVTSSSAARDPASAGRTVANNPELERNPTGREI